MKYYASDASIELANAGVVDERVSERYALSQTTTKAGNKMCTAVGSK